MIDRAVTRMAVSDNNALRQACRHAFTRWEQWSQGRTATGLVAIWAAGEATVWPILPDFILLPVVAGTRRRWHEPLAAAIAGMALSGAGLYLFAYRRPDAALALLERLPTVRPGKAARVRALLDAHGTAVVLIQPWTGVPFKVWAIVAGSRGVAPALAIPAFIVGRTLRLALLAALTRWLAERNDRALRDYSLFLAPAYLVLFFLGWYRLLGEAREPPATMQISAVCAMIPCR